MKVAVFASLASIAAILLFVMTAGDESPKASVKPIGPAEQLSQMIAQEVSELEAIISQLEANAEVNHER